MKWFKKSILFLVMSVSILCETVYAQQTLIDVKIDSAAILIGEQTKLHLTVTTDKDRPVQLLLPTDTLMRGVEVLEESTPDSTLIENDRLLIKQEDTVAQTIEYKRAHICRSLDLQVFGFRFGIMLEEYDRIL